jgi:hypothetical protein
MKNNTLEIIRNPNGTFSIWDGNKLVDDNFKIREDAEGRAARYLAAQSLGSATGGKKASAARANGASGGRPSRPMFAISVLTNEGEKFASVVHLASGCGADFYASGEEFEWQDNNGLFSNCSLTIIQKARKAAEKALA